MNSDYYECTFDMPLDCDEGIECISLDVGDAFPLFHLNASVIKKTVRMGLTGNFISITVRGYECSTDIPFSIPSYVEYRIGLYRVENWYPEYLLLIGENPLSDFAECTEDDTALSWQDWCTKVDAVLRECGMEEP